MATQLLILPLPDGEQAVLCLSHPLTPASLPSLERALRAGLDTLQHEWYPTQPSAGEMEYASWAAGSPH
jgi:hypothetical protein